MKPVSPDGSKRLIRAAIDYAIANGRKSVTLVHKGNIMKFTEGGFRAWGYEMAKEEYGAVEKDGRIVVPSSHGDIIIKDCICDAFLQNILLRPEDYDVIATLNLNGDYVSDALAAEVGGIGIAPGANINYMTGHAVFEATHGTAPDIAGKDIVNPLAEAVRSAVSSSIEEGHVTRDFALLMRKEGRDAEELSTSALTDHLIAAIRG